jgi:tetratricopeptide (TPR) repeat protein
MNPSGHPLDALLERCTVRVWSQDRTKVGTGFFVLPGRIITCAHVLVETKAYTHVDVEWGTRAATATILKLFPDPRPLQDIFPDIAILAFPDTNHPIVLLDQEFKKGDIISSWGYSDLRPAGESLFGSCEGSAKYGYSPDRHLIKFKETQVRPGISGAPLLNERTGAICGMIKRTRDSESDTGGLAIRSEVLLTCLREVIGDLGTQKEHANEWIDTRNRVDTSFYDYLSTLKQFTSSDYRILPLPPGVGIDEVYVPLRLQSLGGDSATDRLNIREVFQTLRSSSRGRNLLIDGAPGAGKSTLLRHIAHNAFDHPYELGLDDKRLPLLVRLQSLAKSSASSVQARLVEAINDAADYQLTVPKDFNFLSEWPQRQEAKWLLLLDGFDEVPREKRATIVKLMQRLESFGCELVLTTRPTDTLLRDYAQTFNHYRIEPFDSIQQQLLAQRLLGTAGDSFLAAVVRSGGQFLQTSPLLITMAASVYRTTQKLPSRRADLYRHFMDDWWKEAESREVLTEIRNDLGPDFASYAQKGLQDIAVVMTERRGLSQTDGIVDELSAVFAQKFGKSLDVVRPQTERFIEIMGRRSGVFIARGSECEWLHRTFREYSCARAFASIDPESTGALDIAKHWRDDEWRQTILFCMSIWSERKSVTPILTRLLGRDPPYGLVFVSDAVAEGTEVEVKLQGELIERLCREAVLNAEGSICPRLMAGISDDSIKRASETLRALLQLKSLPAAEPHFTTLVRALVSFARAWTEERGNAAVTDLAALRRTDELLAIAKDPKLHNWIRWEAAEELGKCGHTADAISALHALVSENSLNAGILTRVLDEIGELGGVAELSTLLNSQTLETKYRVQIIRIFAKKSMLRDLLALSRDQDLEPEVREAAMIGLLGRVQSADKEIAESLLSTATSRVSKAEEIVRLLAHSQNWDALVAIAKHDGIGTSALEAAVAALEGADRIDDLLEFMTQNSASAQLRWLSARAVRRKGKAKEVAEALLAYYHERLQTVGEGDTETLSERAKLNLDIHDYPSAIADLDRILADQPSDEWSLGLRANAHRLAGNYPAAISDFDRALKLDKDDSWDLFRRGITHWRLGHWAHANADFSAVRRLNPCELELYGFYADSLYELDSYDEAFEVICHGIELDFLSPRFYTVRANLYSAVGCWQQAIQDYSQALLLDSTYMSAIRGRAIAYRCSRRYDACISDLNILSRGSENDRWARLNRCELSIQTGDLVAARQEITLLSIDDDGSGWLVYLRWLYSKASRSDCTVDSAFKSIKERLENVLLDNPLEYGSRSNLAIYETAIGDCAKARQIYGCLIDERKVRLIQTTAVPDLETFTTIFPLRTDAAAVLKELVAQVSKILNNYKLRREDTMPYHPVYCTLSAIQGLDKEKSRAEKLLNQHAGSRRTVVLWRLEGDMLYGQCNCKLKPEHEHNLKFVDQLQTILERDLPIFSAADVNRFLFLEQELLQKFEAARDADLDNFLLDYDLIADKDATLLTT